MKAKKIPDIEWSPWRKDGLCGHYTYLHTWRGLTHPEYHKVEMWKFKAGGVTMYQVYCFAGKYGETLYAREIFGKVKDDRVIFGNAKDARAYLEQCALEALKAGDLDL